MDSNVAMLTIKILKVVVLLALVGITLWQGTLNILEYQKHEAVTTVSNKEADSIEFPQITICNYNRWKYSQLTLEDIAVAISAYEKANGQKSSFDVADTNIDIYNFTYNKGWHLVDEYNKNNFNPPKTATTMSGCIFSGVPCNTKFFKHTMTSYGNCYTFNKDLEPADLNDTGTKLPLMQTRAFETNGFEVFIDVEAIEYAEIPTTHGKPALGIKVIVHSKHDQPDPSASGVSIGPGFYATIGLRRIEYHNLPPPEGTCNPQKQLQYFDTYSKTACEMECKMKHVERNCSCRPYFYPKGKTTCNFDDTLGCSSRIIDAVNQDFSKFCDCPDACHYEEFTTSVSYALFPGLSYGYEALKGSNSSLNDLRENVLGIKIYFTDISSTVIKQSEAYSLTSLLNDLGGTSGLYVGFSFVTLIELTEAIMELLHGCLKNKKNFVRQS